MKITVQDLQDTFKLGYNAYLESRNEANTVDNYFHNRQYTSEELWRLDERGQPKETFNIIKLFNRQLIGYYSTVINSIKAKPVNYSDIDIASLLQDTIAYTLRVNNFSNEGDKIKSDGFLSGLFCCYTDVIKTLEKDVFGRPMYKIILEHVPSYQIVLDPMSTRSDYADARWIHRWKWMPKESVVKLFGKKVLTQIEANFNHLDTEESEFTFSYNEEFQGTYKCFDNYLVVHTIIADDAGVLWSYHWCGDVELKKVKVSYKESVNPYRVVKLADSAKAEHYGVYHEVYESQRAINQAVIQIQLMVNSDKVLVQEGAVRNLDAFKKAYSRVNSITEVVNLAGIRVENLSSEVLQQYTIIDKAFDRIQRVLGINDSFLGMAFASDSGRKVKLQQNASISALRYITTKLETLYQLIGKDLTSLIKQYYTANQVLRIADETVGDRWIEINKPLMVDFGRGPAPIYDEVIDPETGEPEKNEAGSILLSPINDLRTEFTFTDVDIEIETSAYNDEDEKNQLMLETMLSGAIGNALMTVNPAGYMKAASLSIKSMKSKHSLDISSILDQTAQMLTPQPQMQQNLGNGGPQQGAQQQPRSESMGLPQNTREMTSGY